MAQSFKCPTLGFGSGHDLVVHEFEPVSGPVLTVQSLPGILLSPPFLSAPPLLVRSLSLSLSLKINKL